MYTRVWTFPCRGGHRRGPLKVAQRVESTMIITISWSSGKLRGPLDVVQRTEFTIYYWHFPILRRGPRTTPCLSNRGICNILAGFSYPQGKLRGPLNVMQRMEFAIDYQHFPILGRSPRTTRCWSKRGISNRLSTFPAPRRSSEDHSTACNAWNLQYIIDISLFSGEIWGPLDVDQTIDFTIDYQHFCVLGRPGGTRDVVQCVEFTIY